MHNGTKGDSPQVHTQHFMQGPAALLNCLRSPSVDCKTDPTAMKIAAHDSLGHGMQSILEQWGEIV
jgi:hypothetical protein